MRLTCLMLPTDLRHSGQRKSCCMSCAWTEFKQPKRKKGGKSHLLQAHAVHRMAASEQDHVLPRVKQVLTAYGAVGFHHLRETSMGPANARMARIAVRKVLLNTTVVIKRRPNSVRTFLPTRQIMHLSQWNIWSSVRFPSRSLHLRHM